MSAALDDRGWRGVVDDADRPRTLFDPPVENELLDDDTIESKFQAFHAAHPEVYEHLRKLAIRMVRRGHHHLGIGMLWEVMRYRSLLGAGPDESPWRLNNSHRSRYVRLLMDQEPQLRDVFEVRSLRES